MHQVGVAPRQRTPALLVLDDEDLAGRSAARLLITAPAGAGVETLARRIHGASVRAALPFVRMSAGDLPIDPLRLRAACSDLLDAAAGGTVLLSEVEEMPRMVQELLIDLLADLESSRAPATPVRVMTGTTVALLDRIAAGTFSERLFYRLNIIHLMTGSPAPRSRADGSPPTDS